MVEENVVITSSKMPPDWRIFNDKSEWLHHGWRKSWNIQFKDAPRLKDFQGQEWMTSPWLKKILKFTDQKCPPDLRIFRDRSDLTMVEENFEIHSSEEISLIEGIIQGQEWSLHWLQWSWLKKFLKFTGLKCPQIEGFSFE